MSNLLNPGLVPLLPKSKDPPDSDVQPLIREIFQDELSTPVPSQKLATNLLKSFCEDQNDDGEEETYRSVEFLENFSSKKYNMIEFAENVFKAYQNHEQALKEIRSAEKDVLKTHIKFLNRQGSTLENPVGEEYLSLKRRPLFELLNPLYVKKYKLLQGDAGLPFFYEIKTDFRVADFKRRRKNLENISKESLGYLEKSREVIPCKSKPKEQLDELPNFRKPRPKNSNCKKKEVEILRAEPSVVFFNEYKIGDIYVVEIQLQNIYSKGVKFQLRPINVKSPFKVLFNNKMCTKIYPGLSAYITVEFRPKTMENFVEEVKIVLDTGGKLLIPLVAYLEPPVLKTHEDVDEFTRHISQRISGSYIECGSCFAGDTKVVKIRFQCYKGCGEFFILSSDNWIKSYVYSVTSENLLDIPPFKVYPVFFKLEKNQVIDLFVEFSPKTPGTHVENILITCDNGEVRSLDILADAVSWHCYYFTFQDSLKKELAVDKEDDIKVKYLLDFEDVSPNEKIEKKFCISNNSNMSFEFQWKIRDVNIGNPNKYLKLTRQQIKIKPESGTFDPHSVWEFTVTISFNNAEPGEYRMVLSLYVLNLPFQSIEEDNTIIQPTGLIRNLYSQSLYGEEECTVPTPEQLSLQGTYESLQGSIKSYIEYQNKVQNYSKNDFCKNYCIPNPTLCAKPLKKSKTSYNLNAGDSTEDEGVSCYCRPPKPQKSESFSESCTSNTKEKNESSVPVSDVTWDFVDILVDEVEIWVEVTPIRASIVPSVIDIGMPMKVNDPPGIQEIEIINHNRDSIVCKWLKPFEVLDEDLYFKETFSCINDYKNYKMKSKVYKSASNLESNRSEKSKASKKSKNADPSCIFKLKPKPKVFSVAGRSTFKCKVKISPVRPGFNKEQLWLFINNGALKLELLVMAGVKKRHFATIPEVLDFGITRQGNRCLKNYKILSMIDSPFYWSVNEYKFDLKTDEFLNEIEIIGEDTKKKEKGMLNKKGTYAQINYYMDPREPGIKCSLLEVEGHENELNEYTKQYIMVLGEVKQPSLTISTNRFKNAILAPSGMMYVGRKITTKVTLMNVGNVDAHFSWGHPFGCHCRKIKVEISHPSSLIKKKKTLTLDFHITALDEGIISHCYIPCFFSRQQNPLILSIVGVVEGFHVTFEIIDYSKHHLESDHLKKALHHQTILRVPWPIKSNNINLDHKFIKEDDILNLRCYCNEVEQEVNNPNEKPNSKPPTTYVTEKSLTSTLEWFGEGYKKPDLQRSSESFNEDTLQSTDSKDSTLSGSDSVRKYTSRECSINTLQFIKSQLDFLDIPFNTRVFRKFVIRNETPIPTTYKISVLKFGKFFDPCLQKIDVIKNRVYRNFKDDYKWRLPRNQPLVLIPKPSEGKLLGHETVSIKVYAYGNTWGEYRDFIKCQLQGLEDFYLKVFVQIIGHPISFPMFENHCSKSQRPVLRFQPVTPTCETDTKIIKVVNQCSIPLTVSWIVLLTTPLMEEEQEEQEESFDLYDDSNANLDSSHSGEETSKSYKNYIPKNASESLSTFKSSVELGEFGETTSSSIQMRSSEESESDFGEGGKISPRISMNEEHKLNLPKAAYVARIDNFIFQIQQKELSFKPFEEKKMTITFSPNISNSKAQFQEFMGVLTAVVKLKPEDEKQLGSIYRPCGINFLSELLDLNGIVEIPYLSFEIQKGDFRFYVDANEVLKSPNKQYTLRRKFSIKNHSQRSIEIKIEVVPGMIFNVRYVNTIEKTFWNYDHEVHKVKIEQGQLLEMELECTVLYKDVFYAYEQLIVNRKKEKSLMSEIRLTKSSSEKVDEIKGKIKKESLQLFKTCSFHSRHKTLVGRCVPCNRTLDMNLTYSKSDPSLCLDSKGSSLTELEGEYMNFTPILNEDFPCKPKSVHFTIIKEEISFVQKGLVAQSLIPELHLSFPVIEISPNTLDFGNVHIKDTAVRYFSLINQTGFPTNYSIRLKNYDTVFVIKEPTGRLPATNYNLDYGKTVTVEFKPPNPGYFNSTFHIYGNLDMEFDYVELFVSGFGTWDEKYKYPKHEYYTKLKGPYHSD